LVAGPAWKWAAMVLGSLGATYFILAHRLWLAYAVIFLAQVGYYFFVSSPDKQIFFVSALMTYGVIVLPPMRPLEPLAAELAIMILAFSYMMLICCIYSAAWAVNGRRVPRYAYGRPLSPFEPLRPSRLLDTLLPGHRSQNVTPTEVALFALSSVLFVAASTAPFYGLRRVQNAFMTVAPQFLACAREGFQTPPHNKQRLPVGRDIIPGAMLSSPGSAAWYRHYLPRSREPRAPLRQQHAVRTNQGSRAAERSGAPRRSHASGATGHCDRRPFAPLPKRRQGRSKVCHEKLVAMIRAEEGKLLAHLGSIVHDLSRRISIRKRQW